MQTLSIKSFRHQFLELVSGTSVAMLLSVLLMPVISRLYLPINMGEYAVYVAISSIAGALSNLRLDLAVVLASEDSEGVQLVWLAIGSSVVVGALVFVSLSFYRPIDEFVIFSAVSVSLIGSVQTLAQWHSRARRYRVLATRNVIEKLTVLILGVVLGLVAMTQFGLIIGQTIGLIFSLVYFFSVSGLAAPRFSFSISLQTLRKFSDFPLKNFFSSALLLFSMYLPSLLFAHYYDKDILGHYNLVSRVFEMPIILIANTFSTVYYQHTSKMDLDERRRLFWSSTRTLIMIFAPIFIVTAIWSRELFPFIFGEQWGTAAEFSRWLAVFTMLRLLFVTQAPLLIVQRKMNMDLFISLVLFGTQVGGFLIGYSWFNSPHASVVTMTILGGAAYVAGLFVINKTLGSKA